MSKRSSPSYTGMVRSELARVDGRTSPERRAELAALITSLGRHSDAGEKLSLQLVTYSAALARKMFRYLKSEHQIGPNIVVKRGTRTRNGNAYYLRMSDHRQALKVFRELDMLDAGSNVRHYVPDYAQLSQDTRAAYLRGLFLGAGHVHPPQRGYHLELMVRHERLTCEGRGLMEAMDIQARVAQRRDGYALYVRGGEQVAHVLTVMGAHRAVLAFEDTRVYRDVRGLVNRLTNAEIANLNKAAAAAVRQVRDIQFVAANGGLASLPESLSVVALARLEHPELSLRELGQHITPPLSKSAVAHRMRRIHLLARSMGVDGNTDGARDMESSGPG